MDNSDQICIAKDYLEIRELRITDIPTVAFVAAQAAHCRLDALKNCIQLGARVCQYASDSLGASAICDQIDKSAKNVKSLLSAIGEATQKHVEGIVQDVFGKAGEDGTFQERVSAQLDNLQRELEGKLDPEKASSITRKLRDAIKQDVAGVLSDARKELNFADPNSPLGLLRIELDAKHKLLDEKITHLITQQSVKSAVSLERFRGASKGAQFEEALHPVLDALCRPRHDQLDRTGNDNGLVGKSRRGDFLVEINPRDAGGTGLRIVLEAKNDRTRMRDLVRELAEAMENRGAQFGIAVSTNPGLLPSNSPPIIFPSPDKAVVYIPDYNDDAGSFDGVYLEVALDVARFLAISLRQSTPRSMDLTAMDRHVGQAVNVLSKFSDLKKRLTTITSTAKEADVLVESIRAEIRTALQAIRDAIAVELDLPSPMGLSDRDKKSA